MAGIAPGYNIDPATATTAELIKFIEKSLGKSKQSNQQRADAKVSPWQGIRTGSAANHAEPYDNLFNGADGLFKDQAFGIKKIPSVRPATEGGEWTGGGYDYSNANWDPIRQQIMDVGQTWNKNAASRTSSNIFSGPISAALSFGVPILAPALAPISRVAGNIVGATSGVGGGGNPSETVKAVLSHANSLPRNKVSDEPRQRNNPMQNKNVLSWFGR